MQEGTIVFEVDKLNPTYLRGQENAKDFCASFYDSNQTLDLLSKWYIMGYVSLFVSPELTSPKLHSALVLDHQHLVEAWMHGNADARGDCNDI